MSDIFVSALRSAPTTNPTVTAIDSQATCPLLRFQISVSEGVMAEAENHKPMASSTASDNNNTVRHL